MDSLTFISQIALYLLGVGFLYVAHKIAMRKLDKDEAKLLDKVQQEISPIKNRVAELSVKLGLKDSFKN